MYSFSSEKHGGAFLKKDPVFRKALSLCSLAAPGLTSIGYARLCVDTKELWLSQVPLYLALATTSVLTMH